MDIVYLRLLFETMAEYRNYVMVNYMRVATIKHLGSWFVFDDVHSCLPTDNKPFSGTNLRFAVYGNYDYI